VNTVIRDAGGWTGHSTDGYGFVRAMLAAGEPLRGRAVAVLGTGGAGRSVARAATDAGAAVTMVSRSPDRVPPGCDAFPRIGWEGLPEQGPFDVVVNATPVGRGRTAGELPVPWVRACAGALAFDLNYAPPITTFLRAARATGARTLNGLSTLVYQACLGAALLLDRDPAAAESYEEDFRAVAREVAPQVSRCSADGCACLRRASPTARGSSASSTGSRRASRSRPPPSTGICGAGRAASGAARG
jgi:shikimate dehydrogenase